LDFADAIGDGDRWQQNKSMGNLALENESPTSLDCFRRLITVLCVTQPNIHSESPVGYGLWPAVVIGGLSMMLVTTLGMLGWIGQINRVVAEMVSRNSTGKAPEHLPGGWIWFAFGLALAMLGSVGHWRRCVLWLTTLLLVAAWAPVLSLVDYAPNISAPWIVVVCSGLCTMVYVLRHPNP
jgi:hypothetical protein